MISLRDKTLVLGYGAIMLMFFVLFLWSTLVPLAESLVVPGHVSVAAQRRTVSHAEGGSVLKLKVREGNHVEAGQTLLQLDDQHLRAELAILEYERFAHKAKLSRWMAERLGEPSIAFDPYLSIMHDQQLIVLRYFRAKEVHSRRSAVALPAGKKRMMNEFEEPKTRFSI